MVNTLEKRKGRPGQGEQEYGGSELMEEDLNLARELAKRVSWGRASKRKKQPAQPKALRQKGTWPCLEHSVNKVVGSVSRAVWVSGKAGTH